jgi:hypothetical protein
VFSQSVSIVTVDGVDTVVVDLPVREYKDGCKYCIAIIQNIPTTATIGSPVAFSIGGDTTTVYPFVKCDCSQITVCGIRTRTRYATIVSTNATSGVFKSLGGICCFPTNNLNSLPIPTTTTTLSTRTTVAKTTKTATKGVEA